MENKRLTKLSFRFERVILHRFEQSGILSTRRLVTSFESIFHTILYFEKLNRSSTAPILSATPTTFQFAPASVGRWLNNITRVWIFTQWADARKLLKVFENVLIALDDQANRSELFDETRQNYAKRSFESLSKWLRKDGFAFNDGHLVSLTRVQSSPVIKELSVEFNSQHTADQVARMQQAIDRLIVGWLLGRQKSWLRLLARPS